MAHTNAWSNTNPLDADDINQGAAEMRKHRLDIYERMRINHRFELTNSEENGEHTYVTLREQGAAPTAAAAKGQLFTMDNGGTDLYMIRDDGTYIYFNTANWQEYQLTLQAGGVWADFVYEDADEVQIRCKPSNGVAAFIGVILNNGKFLMTNTDLNPQLAVPGGGGHILDGITAMLTNALYWICFYETALGALGAGYCWMPVTTFSNNNPTNSLTLNTVNGQNIGFLYSVNSNLLVWNATTKFETLFFDTAGGAYTPNGACYVSARNATTLTLDGALSVANFSANDYVVQLDNFTPLDVTTGAAPAVIGTRGWRDSGVRILTNATPAIVPFYDDGKYIWWSNGTGAANHIGFQIVNTNANAWVNSRNTYGPVDKAGIYNYNHTDEGSYSRDYWQTYGIAVGNATSELNITKIPDKHGIIAVYDSAGGGSGIHVYTLGYEK